MGFIRPFLTEDRRLFIYIGQRHRIGFEFSTAIRFGLKLSQYDDKITLMIAPLFFALFISITFPRSLVRAMDDHEIGFQFHNGCLWISPFKHTMHFAGSMPWWERGFCLHIVDWLIGEPKYSSVNLESRQLVLHMPESNYIVDVQMHRDTWKRRWYWPKTSILRATVKSPCGIPIPGKGENGWDCGDDSVFEMTTPTSDPKAAVKRMRESINSTREKRGGPEWWKKLLPKAAA